MKSSGSAVREDFWSILSQCCPFPASLPRAVRPMPVRVRLRTGQAASLLPLSREGRKKTLGSRGTGSSLGCSSHRARQPGKSYAAVAWAGPGSGGTTRRCRGFLAEQEKGSAGQRLPSLSVRSGNRDFPGGAQRRESGESGSPPQQHCGPGS